MNTPEEIKKGLTPCNDKSECEFCYLERVCKEKEEGLAYIRQLEAELKSYKAEAGVAQWALEITRQELESVKRERDAAVTILESIKTCDTCINKVEAETTYISTDCFHCINMSEHKFRGVAEGND